MVSVCIKAENLIAAGVAELADALDLGSSGQPCRFKSCHPHLKLKSSCLFMKYSSKRDNFFVYYTSFIDIIYLL